MTTINELDLDAITLRSGGHDAQDQSTPLSDLEMCVMEAVAFVAGEPWSASPKCASKVIGAFLIPWNDSLDDEGRQKLKPYIYKLVGSKASKAVEERRAWLAVDWYIHHHTPAWLDLAGLPEVASKIRALPSLLDDDALTAATPLLQDAQKQASAARSAARSAAESAAWSAAESAARSAAWSAAESAARSAAWSAARSAAWSAARSAAESAAWSAAESAARSAARSAAWSAARSAAAEKLAPTVKPLQESALELLDAMLALTDEPAAA